MSNILISAAKLVVDFSIITFIYKRKSTGRSVVWRGAEESCLRRQHDRSGKRDGRKGVAKDLSPRFFCVIQWKQALIEVLKWCRFQAYFILAIRTGSLPCLELYRWAKSKQNDLEIVANLEHETTNNAKLKRMSFVDNRSVGSVSETGYQNERLRRSFARSFTGPFNERLPYGFWPRT